MTQQSTWQSGYIQSGDVRIHYQRQGQGIPIVMAHGFSDSGSCWKAFAQHFVNEYDVVLIDARGHGLSGTSTTGHGNIQQAVDVACLIETLGLERPFVMGHSMGANTTLQTAVNLGQGVRAIILEDPAFFVQQTVDTPSRVDEIRRNIHAWISSMQDMPIEQVMARCATENPTWRAEELHAWAESKQQFGEKMADFGPSQSNPWQELVPQLVVPTLLITADTARGGLVSAEAAQIARNLSAHVEVACIRDAGHCIRREAPIAYLRMVREFLRRHQ